MKKKFFVLLSLLMIVSMLLVSCGPTDEEPTETEEPPASEEPGETEEPTQILGPKYELVCEVDTESYKYWIEGEEGEFSEQNVSDTTRSQKFSPSGDLESVEIELDQKRTYSESGNVYYFKGTLAVNFVQDTVSYEITASGDTLEEPQTCKND